MESASIAAPGGATASGEPTLKKGALGFVSNVVIGVASTAPAYSLAATLGFITAVAGVGVHAPAVLLVSFIPILFISVAYRWLNRADPDAGTTFSWVTKAMGPHMGWINGWAIFLADIIVMAALAQIAAKYTFLLVGWDSAANSNAAQIIAAVIWIAVMTYVCWRGIELSARIQTMLLSAEIVILAVFAVVALVKVYGGSAGAHAIKPSFSWFNPFDMGFTPLVDGILLGIFIYWGWDSGVAVNEESEASNEGPGRAAILSTILLLLIYLVVSASAQAFNGTGFLSNNSDDVLSVLGNGVFGSGWDKLLIFAVLTSSAASTQTTILPTARTTLSMARQKSIPKAFGHIHAKNQTPDYSTLIMGGLSIVWTVLVMALNPAQNVLGDSITALGFAVCFYYGFTGLACAVYYRKELKRGGKWPFVLGLIPFAGFLMMAYVFVKAFVDYSKVGANYSPPLWGIQVPIAIGIGGLLLGLVLMLVFAWPKYRPFFRRKLETAPPGVLDAPVEELDPHLFAHHH